MRKKINCFLFAVFLIFAISISACSSGNNVTGEVSTSFAQCLTENGAKMYGTEWCSHCQNQKKAFGEAFEFVDYVDCDKYRTDCELAGIKGFPTWVIGGEKYSGEQKFSKLSDLTGCVI